MRSLLVLILLSGLTACAASSQKPSGADPVVTDTGSVRSYLAEGDVLQWSGWLCKPWLSCLSWSLSRRFAQPFLARTQKRLLTAGR